MIVCLIGVSSCSWADSERYVGRVHRFLFLSVHVSAAEGLGRQYPATDADVGNHVERLRIADRWESMCFAKETGSCSSIRPMNVVDQCSGLRMLTIFIALAVAIVLREQPSTLVGST